jgi:prepilin-type N-terminal cleavage/methylation domain-containing protein
MFFPNRRQGFSLLELLLTLLLAGLVALIAIPPLHRYARHAALAMTADEVATDMLKIRYLAISKNCRYRLRFYRLDRAYRWEEDLNDNGRIDPLEAVSPFSYLSPGIHFDCAGILGPPATPSKPPASPITFPGQVMSVGPSGRWSGMGTIYLANDYDEHAAISVTIAGRIKVWFWDDASARWR